MTVPIQTRFTAAEFDRIAALPENADRLLEFIDGEIIEKPMPAGPESSSINGTLFSFVGVYVRMNRLGKVMDAQGGFYVGIHRFIPDEHSC